MRWRWSGYGEAVDETVAEFGEKSDLREDVAEEVVELKDGQGWSRKGQEDGLDESVNGEIDGMVDGWMDGQIDGLKDAWIDGWMVEKQEGEEEEGEGKGQGSSDGFMIKYRGNENTMRGAAKISSNPPCSLNSQYYIDF